MIPVAIIVGKNIEIVAKNNSREKLILDYLKVHSAVIAAKLALFCISRFTHNLDPLPHDIPILTGVMLIRCYLQAAGVLRESLRKIISDWLEQISSQSVRSKLTPPPHT